MDERQNPRTKIMCGIQNRLIAMMDGEFLYLYCKHCRQEHPVSFAELSQLRDKAAEGNTIPVFYCNKRRHFSEMG